MTTGKLTVSNSQLVREYQTTSATSYSLAAKYGVSQAVITRRLRENISEYYRKILEGQKKSAAGKRKWAVRKAS